RERIEASRILRIDSRRFLEQRRRRAQIAKIGIRDAEVRDLPCTPVAESKRATKHTNGVKAVTRGRERRAEITPRDVCGRRWRSQYFADIRNERCIHLPFQKQKRRDLVDLPGIRELVERCLQKRCTLRIELRERRSPDRVEQCGSAGIGRRGG